MRQTVTIQENKDGRITAGCDRTACEGCKGSFFCISKKAEFQVLNPEGIPLEKGDQAEIDLPSGKTLFTVFMSLGLPLLMFLPGYFIGTLLSDSQGIIFLSAIAGVALGFLISAIFFRVRRSRYIPVVTGRKE